MKKYTRIPVEVKAIEFQEGQGIEDGYLVYDTEYPEEGHYAVPVKNCDRTRQTVLSAAIYNYGTWMEIQQGDFLVVRENEKSVWKKEKFEKEFAPSV